MPFSPDSSYESCGSYSNSSPDPMSLDYTKHLPRTTEPHLVMTVAPETHFRYRYDTEMSGAHGSLQADRGGREKQIPTVELAGYTGQAVIRVSLATCNEGARYPHPHYLFAREKLYQKRYRNLEDKQLYRTGHYMDPHYIVVSDTNYIGKFEGLCIISTKKENFQRTIREKLIYRGHEEDDSLERSIQEALKCVDIAYVCLCFEALQFDDDVIGDPICPPLYSAAIANAKNASSGKLKITRINKCTGSCMGGDSIWLLVEKINKKGLVVRFFEQNADGSVEWESIVEGDKLELHYQYAVIFNTPPYRDLDITRSVTVSMRLERRVVPYDYSDAETFVYEPSKQRIQRSNNPIQNTLCQKALSSIGKDTLELAVDAGPMMTHATKKVKQSKRVGSVAKLRYIVYFTDDNLYRKESLFSSGLANKRPMEDLICPYDVPTKRRNEELNLTDDDYSFELAPHQNKEYHAILMELFRLDSVVQTDGPADDRQRVVMRVLQALLARAKLREDEIKLVTDKISRLFLKPEQQRVEDAASTLLSLRTSRTESNAVFEAVLTGNVAAVEMALRQGGTCCDVNEEGQTPLHVAVQHGKPEIVHFLLKQKSCRQWINVRDKNGLSAIHIAVSRMDEPSLSALVAAGGDVNLDDAITGRNTLDMAVETRHPGVVQAVLDKFNLTLPRKETLELSPARLVEEATKITATATPVSQKTLSGPRTSLEKVGDILNATGKWETLACLMDMQNCVASASTSVDPAKFIFDSYQVDKKLDLEVLRSLLDALEVNEAVAVIDETLAKRFM